MNRIATLNVAYDKAPYGDPAYKRTISKIGKAMLKKVADALGLEKGAYRLDYNPGGIAVPGEVMLHTEHYYIMICCQLFGSGATVLYRTCEGREDYCGGPNNWASLEALDDAAGFVKRLERLPA